MIRIALAGYGSMGRHHARVLAEHPDVQLVAIADPIEPGDPPAAWYCDTRDMLDAVAPDALVVATPSSTHAVLALEAIQRAIPVLVEKPLAATWAEAERIAVADRGLIQVGHLERHNPAVVELGRLLRSGWLSSIYSIAARRAGPYPARVRDVGVAIDLATHDLDVLCWLACERPIRVYGESAKRLILGREDLLCGILRFPSGAVGMVEVNWLTPVKHRELVVTGPEGMFELDYLQQRLMFVRADMATEAVGHATTFPGSALEVAVVTREPLAAQLDAFLEVVRGGIPSVGAAEGAWAVRLAEALMESAERGEVVAV